MVGFSIQGLCFICITMSTVISPLVVFRISLANTTVFSSKRPNAVIGQATSSNPTKKTGTIRHRNQTDHCACPLAAFFWFDLMVMDLSLSLNLLDVCPAGHLFGRSRKSSFGAPVAPAADIARMNFSEYVCSGLPTHTNPT
mmetsp:Transcript_8273/g.16052  ORF Transcript_8273/g.16052 Transcript_8273/m.16052 type:complete len:141 (-) Transcript_8273:13-435(-)